MSYPTTARARPATLEDTARGRQCEHQPQRQSWDRDAGSGSRHVPLMRKVANDHTARVTTGRNKSSPSVMGGAECP